MNKWWLVGFVMPAIAGIIWITMKSAPDGKAPARPIATEKQADVAASLPVALVPRKTTNDVSSSMPAAPSVAPKEQTEPMTTKDLQALLDKDPAAALVIARRDLAKDPNGPDAAERNWVIVKSLAVLGRYEEAKREAEVMVPKFRDTRWANDIERHILAHP